MPTNTLNGPGAPAAPLSPTPARAPQSPARPDARARSMFEPGAFEHLFDALVESAVKRGATDIHVRAGDVVQARVDGVLVAFDTPVLSPDDTLSLAVLVIESNGSDQRIVVVMVLVV